MGVNRSSKTVSKNAKTYSVKLRFNYLEQHKDDYLLDINQRFLTHDTYTDIISFDDSIGNLLNGDIYISTERVRENALEFNEDFETELKRVLVHGILHYCGYKDKSDEEAMLMREKESEKIKLFHVEQS